MQIFFSINRKHFQNFLFIYLFIFIKSTSIFVVFLISSCFFNSIFFFLIKINYEIKKEELIKNIKNIEQSTPTKNMINVAFFFIKYFIRSFETVFY